MDIRWTIFFPAKPSTRSSMSTSEPAYTSATSTWPTPSPAGSACRWRP